MRTCTFPECKGKMREDRMHIHECEPGDKVESWDDVVEVIKVGGMYVTVSIDGHEAMWSPYTEVYRTNKTEEE